ncbi:MAG: HAMP domain-containing histidine kinase [Halobacteriovoraceae bacterium]|nr:HAMP domain-containing histidine kinase [Halobacteriovoraceae bacterium]MCB9095084.1 HAMP domain-containing histidine kinase [Halobacteriovoraceae bacterium]
MELRKIRKWLYATTIVWIVVMLSLGIWWTYLLTTMAEILEENQIALSFSANLYQMFKWEGIFFIILLVAISMMVFYLLHQDVKKSNALQAFFASLTHELKTPLANIRLQSEILGDQFKDDPEENIKKTIHRLTTGSYELEDQFDNMLQLSRLENSGTLNLESFNFNRFLKNIINSLPYSQMSVDYKSAPDNLDILADEFALKVIFRNLFQNTIRHNKSDEYKVEIQAQKHGDTLQVNYYDHGRDFTGDPKKLGNLFYKHKSSQGSGIGLYIVNKLISQMGGRLEIQLINKKLHFKLFFRIAE